jgi:hypothetical protein
LPLRHLGGAVGTAIVDNEDFRIIRREPFQQL